MPAVCPCVAHAPPFRCKNNTKKGNSFRCMPSEVRLLVPVLVVTSTGCARPRHHENVPFAWFPPPPHRHYLTTKACVQH